MNNLSSTLGVDFQVKMLRVDERNIALQLWDTAGEKNYEYYPEKMQGVKIFSEGIKQK